MFIDHIELIGKRVVDFLLVLSELFFARYYGWNATSENTSKIDDFAPTPSLWLKISGRSGCLARLWDNFYQVWPSTTYPCLNYSVFNVDTLWHAVTLTFDPLILKVRGTSSETWAKSNNPRLNYGVDNFANLCTRYVTPWPWPLTSWPWTVAALAFKRCTQFQGNRIFHGWVIDDLARFTVQF